LGGGCRGTASRLIGRAVCLVVLYIAAGSEITASAGEDVGGMVIWRREDVNNDCRVNVLDLIAVRNHLGTCEIAYDVNGDLTVNVLDLIAVRNQLGSVCECMVDGDCDDGSADTIDSCHPGVGCIHASTSRVYYLDVDNGGGENWQPPDGYPPGEVCTSWEELFGSSWPYGKIYGIASPAILYVLPRADPEHEDISVRAIDCGSTHPCDNLRIIGVNWPKIYNSQACTISVVGVGNEITGLQVEHPMGNGIHIMSSASYAWVHNNRFVGDCSSGSDVAVDGDFAVIENNVIDPTVHNYRIGVMFYSATDSIARNNIIRNRRQFVYFAGGSVRCRSVSNVFADQQPIPGYMYAIQFTSSCTGCTSEGDTLDGIPLVDYIGTEVVNPEVCAACSVH